MCSLGPLEPRVESTAAESPVTEWGRHKIGRLPPAPSPLHFQPSSSLPSRRSPAHVCSPDVQLRSGGVLLIHVQKDVTSRRVLFEVWQDNAQR